MNSLLNFPNLSAQSSKSHRPYLIPSYGRGGPNRQTDKAMGGVPTDKQARQWEYQCMSPGNNFNFDDVCWSHPRLGPPSDDKQQRNYLLEIQSLSAMQGYYGASPCTRSQFVDPWPLEFGLRIDIWPPQQVDLLGRFSSEVGLIQMASGPLSRRFPWSFDRSLVQESEEARRGCPKDMGKEQVAQYRPTVMDSANMIWGSFLRPRMGVSGLNSSHERQCVAKQILGGRFSFRSLASTCNPPCNPLATMVQHVASTVSTVSF